MPSKARSKPKKRDHLVTHLNLIKLEAHEVLIYPPALWFSGGRQTFGIIPNRSHKLFKSPYPLFIAEVFLLFHFQWKLTFEIFIGLKSIIQPGERAYFCHADWKIQHARDAAGKYEGQMHPCYVRGNRSHIGQQEEELKEKRVGSRQKRKEHKNKH